MKRFYNILLQLVLLSILASGCVKSSQEEGVLGNDDVDLSIGISRAAANSNGLAVAEEMSIESAYVYIFNSSGVLENSGNTAVTGLPVSVDAPPASDLLNHKWRVKEGRKSIYVILNPKQLTQVLAGWNPSSAADVKALVTTDVRADGLTLFNSSASGGSKLMTGSAENILVSTSDGKKTVEVDVDRRYAGFELHLRRSAALAAASVKVKEIRIRNITWQSCLFESMPLWAGGATDATDNALVHTFVGDQDVTAVAVLGESTPVFDPMYLNGGSGAGFVHSNRYYVSPRAVSVSKTAANDGAKIPYFEIKATVSGKDVVYKAYFTELTSEKKCDLSRPLALEGNHLYYMQATLGVREELELNILDWNEFNSDVDVSKRVLDVSQLKVTVAEDYPTRVHFYSNQPLDSVYVQVKGIDDDGTVMNVDDKYVGLSTKDATNLHYDASTGYGWIDIYNSDFMTPGLFDRKIYLNASGLVREIDVHTRVSIETIVEFEESYGQNAVLYLGKADADNFYKGNGWIDDPSWTAIDTKDLEVPIHGFKVRRKMKITAPNSDKIKFTTSSVGIDAWKGLRGDQIPAGDRTLVIDADVQVQIIANISTAGAFMVVWDVEDFDTGATYTVKLENKGHRASFVAETDFITGITEYVSLTNIVGYGFLDVSRAVSDGAIDTKANNTALAQANPGHTEIDLGYRSDRLLTRNSSEELTYYYVTQTGFGYSLGTAKMAKIRQSAGAATTEKDWGYYIPSGDPAVDNVYTTDVGNEVVFMIGRSEGLEITDYTIGISETTWTWNHWAQRYSWSVTKDNFCTNGADGHDNSLSTELTSVHQRLPESTYGWPNNQGLYPMINKPYGHFEFNGSEDACAYVFPRGYWRAPTEVEVESWATDYKYPHSPSYDQGFVFKFGNNPIEYIDPPYVLISNGAYGFETSIRSKGVVVGPFYFAANLPGSFHLVSSYPLIYTTDALGNIIPTATSSPLADLRPGYDSRDAATVFCIRD